MSDKPRHLQRKSEPNKVVRRGIRELARQRGGGESLFAVDRQVGKIVRTLKRTGEWGNTVLMFTSDNGYFLGEHRQRVGKITGHEPSIRVPFLVTGPGMRSGERRFDPITTIDVTATILDLGNATKRLAARHPLDGVSRLGFTDRGRSYIGIRSPRYSLIRYIGGALELYDHRDDANQMQSRHADPDYWDTRRQLLQVWNDYKDCLGAACQDPLPGDLQAAPPESRG